MAALRHNTYFRAITFQDIARKEIIPLLANTLQFNRYLTVINLRNLPDSSGLADVAEALRLNPHNAIQIIDFSGSKLNYKAVINLSAALASFTHGLRVLNLSNCG